MVRLGWPASRESTRIMGPRSLARCVRAPWFTAKSPRVETETVTDIRSEIGLRGNRTRHLTVGSCPYRRGVAFRYPFGRDRSILGVMVGLALKKRCCSMGGCADNGVAVIRTNPSTQYCIACSDAVRSCLVRDSAVRPQAIMPDFLMHLIDKTRRACGG